MKILNCPLNGPRNISEFICFGQVTAEPGPDGVSDEQWVDYVWLRDTPPGVVREWWCHVPSSYWFIAERNTVTDEIVKTYPANGLAAKRNADDVP